MPASADDDVVVHGNAKRRGNFDDRLRHLDIGLRWRGIARRVIVQEKRALEWSVLASGDLQQAGGSPTLAACSKCLPQSGMSGSSPQIADPTLLAAADPTRFAAENGEPMLALSVER
jgi:hypothetical protein